MSPRRTASDPPARAARIVAGRLGRLAPRLGLVLGSGLGPIADTLENPIAIPYARLPEFPSPGVEGHAGRLIAGSLAGVPVICLAGRAHAYEAPPTAAYLTPVRTLFRLGVDTLILTNAAGSLSRDIPPGRIMLISDHINFLGMNPLAGANDARYGPRFPDLKDAYDPGLRREFRAAARRARIPLSQGIYLAYPGPSFETAAEVRAFRRLGADAVGMSTVPETIAARHCGMRVAALSVIVNHAQGMTAAPPSHAETMRIAGKAASALTRLLRAFLAARRQ